MKRLHCTALLLSCLLVACSQPSSAPKVTDVIATVNGKPLPRSEFEMYVANIERQATNGRKLDPKQRDAALDDYIGMHLAAEAALKLGIDKEQAIADELAFARVRVLGDARMQRYLRDNPVKDDELKPAYDKGIAELPPQYHISRILVDNPGTAEELITQLKGGANFTKLAKQHTIEEEKATGGDIGWWVPDHMPPEYNAALAELKPGEVFQTPVKTSRGWHVVRLEEKKPQDVDPFEDVKDKVRLMLTQQRVKDYLKTLREEAKIDVEQRAPKI